MARKYILRRIIPRRDCPGTCCKVTGAFPDTSGSCIHYSNDIVGRPQGGCPFFSNNNSINTNALQILNQNDQQVFNTKCNGYPCPTLIPELDTPYDHMFGRSFGEECPCFEWEIIKD